MISNQIFIDGGACGLHENRTKISRMNTDEYLTGLTSREAVLILAPTGIVVDRWETTGGPELGRGRKVNELLFVEERSQSQEFMDGATPSHSDLRASSGIAEIYSLSKLNEILGPALMAKRILSISRNEGSRLTAT